MPKLTTNLGTFDLSNDFFTKSRIANLTITDEQNYSLEFTADSYSTYNRIIDSINLSVDELFEYMDKGKAFFTEYDITRKMFEKLDKYVNSLYYYHNTWKNLFILNDYNAMLFKHRMLPFISSESKEWKKINVDVVKSDYPTEIANADLKTQIDPKIDNDFREEHAISLKENNFNKWPILPVSYYPNLDRYFAQIAKLEQFGMKNLVIKMCCLLLLSPKDCHIVGMRKFWNILNKYMEQREIYQIVEYCSNYAMYILRQEETIMFSKVEQKYRVLYDLDDASSICTFNKTHIERSPFVLQLPISARISECIPFYLVGDRKINDYDTFKRRFKIATGGAFEGFDLASIGAAITGSILIPCVHTSPLEKVFANERWSRKRATINLEYEYMIDNPAEEDIGFINYLEYYYASYVSLSDDDYRDQVLQESHCEFDDKPIEPSQSLFNRFARNIQDKEFKRKLFDEMVERKIANNSWLNDDENIISREIEKGNKELIIESDEENQQELQDINQDIEREPNQDIEQEPDQEELQEPNQEELQEDNPLNENKTPNDNAETDENLIPEEVENTAMFGRILSESQRRFVGLLRKKRNRNRLSNSQKREKQRKARLAKKEKQRKAKEKAELLAREKQNKVEDKSVAKIEYNQLADIDISITTADQAEFNQRVKLLYQVIVKNCSHRGAIYIKQIKTIANIKYKIYGPGLPRPIDIFRIPYDPAKMVKKFHVHPVKMYYDGKITMFRSCIASLLSGVGESYKWFSCNKNPADVLLKYAQRGLSIILNKKERLAISQYIESNPRWSEMIKHMGIKSSKIYFATDYHNVFFRSGAFGTGIRMGLRPFGKTANHLHMTNLVTSYSVSYTEFGDLKIRNNNEWFVPDTNLIQSCLNYIDATYNAEEAL